MNRVTVDRDDETSILRRLRAVTTRLPDEFESRRMRASHQASIQKALDHRGDPFGREDILVLRAEDQVVRIPVRCLPVSVGSSRAADFIVRGEGISRCHARFERDGAFVKILDLESKNGTFLNGKRVRTEHLCLCDNIGVGRLVLHVERT